MVALKIHYNYMVQARKETPIMFHYREKCLNHSRLNEFSVVSINKAILTGKPAPTRPIVKTRSLEQIGKLSSMILRYVNLVMTICSQKSFTLNHHLSAVEKYLRKSYSNLSPIHGYGSAKGMTLSQDTDCLIPKLLGLGSAYKQKRIYKARYMRSSLYKLPIKRKEVIC